MSNVFSCVLSGRNDLTTYPLFTYIGGIQLADVFKEQMEPIASKIPFMTCPGNHERFPDPGGRNGYYFRN